MKDKSRTRNRWASKDESFSEINTKDEFIDEFEDAYPEFFNSITKLQVELTDTVLKEDNLDKLIDKPLDSVDDFVRLASTMVSEGKDVLPSSVKKKNIVNEESNFQVKVPFPVINNLQTFIIILRDSLLVFLLFKILLYGFNY